MGKNDQNEEDMYFSFDEVFDEPKKNCPREPELLLYAQDLLSGQDRERLETHLKACSTCTTELLDLHTTERMAEATELDERKAEPIFEQNLVRLQRHLDQKQGSSQPAPTGWAAFFTRFFGSATLPAYANAIMAALILVLVYPAYKSFMLDRQLVRVQNQLGEERAANQSRIDALDAERRSYEAQARRLSEAQRRLLAPQLSSSAIQTVKPERAAEAKTIAVKFSAQEKSFNLLFAVQAAGFDTYVVEISQNRSPLWRNEIKATTDKLAPSHLISVTLHADYFKAGAYQLAIYGKTARGDRLWEEYHLNIQ